MRRLIILSMILISSVSISAKDSTINPNRNFFTYSYDNAVFFVERGIEFSVFINGDFDFFYSRNFRYSNFRNPRVIRDFDGRIRRIGTIRIAYDRRGNVRRIGNIRIGYFRGRLSSVGNLRVRYDRWGYPLFYGQVNAFNSNRFNSLSGTIYYYNHPFFRHRDFRRNYTRVREDREFIYYKAKPNTGIQEGNGIIKRRKSEARKRTRNATNRNANTYRKSNINKKNSAERRRR